MQPPELPSNEAARLRELKALGILDTPADASFDDISELVRHVAGTEIGIISLVDSDRQWFKSCVGLPLGQEQSPRSVSFCGHTILQREPLIIEDAHQDPRFVDNPLVQGEPWIRFYAGFPLITDTHFAIGSLCAISRHPHRLSPDQIESLRRLAGLTVQHMQNLRDASIERDRQLKLAPQMLPGLLRDDLRSLEQLISRDQMLAMLDLILGMETDAKFSLLRCRFRDYERVSATFGGLVAEEFINEGARRLIIALPRGASVARFADTELVVLLPFGDDGQDMERVAERIIALTGQAYRNGQHSLSLAVSIGIATYHHNYETVEAILSDASIAVQMARRTSGSSFRFIDAESRLIARENYRIESDLRDALQGKLLELHLQPIIALADAEPIGFEALARWPRGEQLLAPSSFIPMLAEAGLTAELDLLIIEKALAAMPLLARPVPQRQMRVSVNLSGLLLEDGEQQQRLLALIDDNPFPPGWSLQVEIVEDAFQAKTELFERFLAALVARGVVIAIDDFGTGYSSLTRLISLPIQMVKLDRAFVQNLDASTDSGRTLLRTMIVMLRDLGLSITAEGVETASQRDWLHAHGVSAAQGFLFHRPMSVSEAIALLETLHYRPRALAVDPQRLQAVRRRLRSNFWRRPFLDRFGPGSAGSDRRQP
jgi:EAL domain-containing protein (putative c-di-GMP-specific phosphodiesterase class I)/GGDEF domain-containing protein